MAATRISVFNDGAIKVEGDFEIVDQDGRVYDLAGRTSVKLCRCGQSAKKPFCDGTHKRCGFESVVEAYRLDPPVPKPGA